MNLCEQHETTSWCLLLRVYIPVQSGIADVSRYSEAIRTAHLRAIVAMSIMQIGYDAVDWKRTLAFP